MEDEIKVELQRRGLRVAQREREVELRCVVCNSCWTVPIESVEKPTERNHFWWCPSGCNREE